MGLIEDLRLARTKKRPDISPLINKLFSDCLKVIQYKNKSGETSMVYLVPSIYIGHPVYDHQEASYCLYKLLKKKGFKVIQNNKKLIISWN